MSNQLCKTQWLGQVDFKTAWKLQKELAAKRALRKIPDTLLLLEHPPVYTLGFEGNWEHLRISQEEMTQREIAYYRVDRSGPIIYHGPGQLVGYPILNLAELGYSYHEYVRTLARVIIKALSIFKVRAFQKPGRQGVWVLPHSSTAASSWTYADDETAMIAIIGINVDKQNITRHGFFINVNLNPEHFDFIIPHGFHVRNITSLQRVLNRPIETKTFVRAVVQSFCETFNLNTEQNVKAA